MDNHQMVNAQVLERCQGGWLLTENTMTPQLLAARLTEILHDPDLLARTAENARAQGRPDATTVLGDLVDRLAVKGAAGAPETASQTV